MMNQPADRPGLLDRLRDLLTGPRLEGSADPFHPPRPSYADPPRPRRPLQGSGDLMAHPSMLEQPRVQVKRPTSRREVKEMGDSFKAGHQLVVDLGRVRSAEDKRYIVAFLLGVTHGLNGKAKRINADVYLFAPSRFQIEAPEEFTGRSSSAEEWFEEQLREPLVLDEPEA